MRDVFDSRGTAASLRRGGGVAAYRRVRWIILLMSALAPGLAPGAQTPLIRRDSALTIVDRETAVARALAASARTDSADGAAARAAADSASGLRLVISVADRRLWMIEDADTLLTAPVAVGRDSAFHYQGRQWVFRTRRGRRTVVRKDSLPVWIPPDWHYYEVGRARGLLVRRLVPGQPVALMDGGWLVIRDSVAGVLGAKGDSVFTPLPAGDEIIFDGFLFMPPIATTNRRIPGELGRYRLDLGDGFMLHGTPYQDSIGEAVTHGCIRLRDDDLRWLHQLVPVGTTVFIY